MPLRRPTEGEVSAGVRLLLQAHRNVALATRLNVAAGYFVPQATMRRIVSDSGGAVRYEARYGAPRWMEHGAAGWADYIGMLEGGRFLAVEVKRPGPQPPRVRAEQAEFLRRVNSGGGLGLVVSDVGQLDALLRAEAGRIDHTERP